MNKELEIFRFIKTKLEQNQRVVLMIVVQSSGSSPGRQGFKMVVAEDEISGSIGGGVMEVSLVKLAQRKHKNAKGKIIEQVHKKNSPDSSGMICSGKQTVIFKLLSKENNLNMIERIINYLSKGENTVFLQITEKIFQTVEVDNFPVNFFDYHFEKKQKESFSYFEKLGYKQKLFIIGGGHCALALSELMAKMDFHISLFDDRPNLNTLDKNKFAHSKTIIESYENIGEFVEGGENVYIVVMTLGYKFDEIVIRQLFYKNFKYFGVLGSKAKMKTLLRNLEKEGFDKDKLKQIHTPIGLPINSHTPEEIAVSIAAEIIAVKNS